VRRTATSRHRDLTDPSPGSNGTPVQGIRTCRTVALSAYGRDWIDARRREAPVSGPLDRTFEALVFDWDGTAVPDRAADATGVRERVEALSRAGVHIAVVSGTHVGNVDGQLRARPPGPGRLWLCLNRGSEVFEVGQDGPAVRWRRESTPDEDAALDRAAALTIERLADRGLESRVVSQRLNRRKIDVIPEPEWDDPPKARIDALLDAVTARLADHGVESLAEIVAIAMKAAADAGLPSPRVTSDVKHVEIGLTDKTDSMRWVLSELATLGIGPGLVLVGGDEFGSLGGVIGSDANLLVPEASRAVAVSVGLEPAGVPVDVLPLGGGPVRFLALLDDQLRRREEHRTPTVDEDPRWVVSLLHDPLLERVNESLATLANGRVGVRGALEEDGDQSSPLLVAGGVYEAGDPPKLLPGPLWTSLMLSAGSPGRRLLDLRTGVLFRDRPGRNRGGIRTLRFLSLARPGAMGMRAEGSVREIAGGERLRPPVEDRPVERGQQDGIRWARTRSTLGGGITMAAAERDGSADGGGGTGRVGARAAHHRTPHHVPRRGPPRRALGRRRRPCP
jgi:hypothetical protein